ncbi:MAG: tetratricopeptide repeat protein [Chthoniobacterales bacterium]|nr:tetratricopeptide repeat protein [Chthoniobacterales bacterium]
MKKGEEKLWRILQDKLEMLLAGQQLPEALRVAETAFELARRIFPENHPSLAQSYERLGQIHGQRDKDDEAESSLRQALVAHSDLGTMLNNVALIYRRSERQEAAEPYYLQALTLYEKQLGPEHADVAAVLNNLGVFYTSAGRLEEAEQMHQRALGIRRKSNPKAHSDIAQSKCNLAVVYHARGDLTRASELYQESLRQWEGVEKPSEDYEIVASNYADLVRSLGKRRRAGAIESRARKIRART